MKKLSTVHRCTGENPAWGLLAPKPYILACIHVSKWASAWKTQHKYSDICCFAMHSLMWYAPRWKKIWRFYMRPTTAHSLISFVIRYLECGVITKLVTCKISIVVESPFYRNSKDGFSLVEAQLWLECVLFCTDMCPWWTQAYCT